MLLKMLGGGSGSIGSDDAVADAVAVRWFWLCLAMVVVSFPFLVAALRYKETLPTASAATAAIEAVTTVRRALGSQHARSSAALRHRRPTQERHNATRTVTDVATYS